MSLPRTSLRAVVPRARRPSLTALVALAGWAIVGAGVVMLIVRPAMPIGDTGLGARELLPGDGLTHSYDGSRTTITDSLTPFNRTVRITAADEGTEVDKTALVCHGGRVDVTWHVGNLEPTVPATGIHLSATLDGATIGSLLAGSTDGIWNDRPAGIHAVVACPAGTHVLALRIVSVQGSWGMPYVVSAGSTNIDGLVVNRGFVVTEVWDREP